MSEAAQKTETRVPYKIELEEHVPFEENFSGKYIYGQDFCKLTNEVMRAAFSGYVGCKLEINSGYPTLALFFDHCDYDENDVVAVERVSQVKVGSTILDKTRSRDIQVREGDRYRITEDGMDVIKPLLVPRYYNGGKPNWKAIVTDVVERSTGNMFQPQNQTQITKVIGIDPAKICQLIYGNKDEKGGYIDYGVEVKANFAMGTGIMGQATNYVLAITRANVANITKTCESFGITGIGSDIIR